MRAAVTLLVLALAPLATTRAEVVHLLEDFSDAQRFFTDAGASLGPGFWDSGAMNASVTDRRSRRRRPAVESRDPRLPAGDERPAAGFRASSPRAFLGGVQAVPRAVALAGLLESDVAGAAVASARRRAAATGAAAHLVVAARAQVIPPDEPDARRRRAADLSSPARRVSPYRINLPAQQLSTTPTGSPSPRCASRPRTARPGARPRSAGRTPGPGSCPGTCRPSRSR